MVMMMNKWLLYNLNSQRVLCTFITQYGQWPTFSWNKSKRKIFTFICSYTHVRTPTPSLITMPLTSSMVITCTEDELHWYTSYFRTVILPQLWVNRLSVGCERIFEWKQTDIMKGGNTCYTCMRTQISLPCCTVVFYVNIFADYYPQLTASKNLIPVICKGGFIHHGNKSCGWTGESIMTARGLISFERHKCPDWYKIEQ